MKAKSKIKLMAALSAAVMAMTSLGACMGQVVDKVDSSQVVINVEAYKGGLGYTWLERLAAEFEEKHKDTVTTYNGKQYKGVDIVINGDGETMGFNVKANYAALASDMYFTDGCTNYYENATGGYLLDVTEDLTKSVNSDGTSVLDKLYDGVSDFFGIVGKDAGGGKRYYSMPLALNTFNLNYDVEMFFNYGLYFKKDHSRDYKLNADDKDKFITPVDYIDEGETANNATVKTIDYYRTLVTEGGQSYYKTKNGDILACGPDGVYGTADDGEPETYADLLALFAYMLAGDSDRPSITPIIHMNNASNYVTTFMTTLVHDFGTKEQAQTFVDFQGKLTNVISSIEDDGTITYDAEATLDSKSSGNDLAKVYKTEACYRVLELMEKIYTTDGFVSSDVTNKQNDHFLSEKKLMLSSKRNPNGYSFNGVGGKRVAFLVDGTHWENEAYDSGKYDEVVKECGDAFKRENRMFKTLSLPKCSEDNLGEQIISSDTFSTSGFILNRVAGTEKEALAREFFAYVFSDHGNEVFTEEMGMIRPFDYSTEDIQTNYFSKTLKEKYDNCELIVPQNTQPRIKTNGTMIRSCDTFVCKINGKEESNIISMFMSSKYTAKQIFNGMYEQKRGILVQ